MAGRTVLTASHVLRGATAVQVRTTDKKERPCRLRADGRPGTDGPDLALLTIEDDTIDMPPAPLGRVDRDASAPIVPCHAWGYPEFAELHDHVGAAPVRETVSAVGSISPGSNLVSGLLSLQVNDAPRDLPPTEQPLTKSPWSGISGGPVFHRGCLVGLVTVHGVRAGSGALNVTPLTAVEADPGHPRWGNGVDDPQTWWTALSVRGIEDLYLLRDELLPLDLPTDTEVQLKRLLRHPRTTTGGLDLATLRLGSALIEGNIPPYAPRKLDGPLRELLASENVVFVSGAPKSGKTRTLVEALRATKPTAEIWWVSTARSDGFDRLIALVAHRVTALEREHRDLVVVLDDVQRLGAATGELSEAHIYALTEAGAQVAGTVSNHALHTGQLLSIDHRGGLGDGNGLIDSALVDLLSSSSQYLDSSMDTSELSTIPDELAMVLRRSGRDPDLAPRIAETLAAVEQLDASARSAVLDPRRSERGALVVAAFDAAFLYPRGATEEELRQLYAFALPQLWPTRPATDAGWADAVDWASMPIGGFGSTEAMLRPEDRDGERRLSLHDALVARWQSTPPVPMMASDGRWDARRLVPHTGVLGPDALFAASRAYLRTVDELAWLRPAADAGNGYAELRMADVFSSGAEALEWARRAVAHGNTSGHRFIGETLMPVDRRQAIEEFRLAARGNDSRSAAILAQLVADPDVGPVVEQALVDAAEAGNPHAARVVGEIAVGRGHTAVGVRHLVAALRRGEPGAAPLLGKLVTDPDVGPVVEQALVDAAEAGNPHAARVIGEITLGRGSTAAGVGYLMAALRRGEHGAASLLGQLVADPNLGQIVEQALVDAAEAGNSLAARVMGEITVGRGQTAVGVGYLVAALRRGEPGTAPLLGKLVADPHHGPVVEQALVDAAETGNPHAARVMGEITVGRGQTTVGVGYLVAALRRGEHGAATVLAALVRDPDLGQVVEPALVDAAEAGNPRAARVVGEIALARGDAAGAARYLAVAVRQGDSGATNRLSEFMTDPDLRDEAERVVRQAAGLGNADAALLIADLELAHGNVVDAVGYLATAARQGMRPAVNRLTKLSRDPDVAQAVETVFERIVQSPPNSLIAQRCMGELAAVRGDRSDAARLLEPAAGQRDFGAAETIGDLAFHPDVSAEAKAILAAVAKKGNRVAWRWLGMLARAQGDARDAVRCLARATRLGDYSAAYELAELVADPQVGNEAEAALRDAATRNYPTAAYCWGVIQAERGDRPAALDLFLIALDNSSRNAAQRIAELASAAELGQACEDALRSRAASGKAGAGRYLASLLLQRGDRTGAAACLVTTIDHGDVHAVYDLMALAIDPVDGLPIRTALESLARRSLLAVRVLADVLLAYGDVAGAVGRLEDAAQHGDCRSARRLGKMLNDPNSRDQAREALRRLMAADVSPPVRRNLGNVCWTFDKPDALRQLSRAAESGDRLAAARLADLVMDPDVSVDAEDGLKIAASNNRAASRYLGELLVERGDVSTGINHLEHAAALGDHRGAMKLRDLVDDPDVGPEAKAALRNSHVVSVPLPERGATSRAQKPGDLLAQLHKGDVRNGVVSSVMPYGAFVDLGGASGLVHKSELAWNHVADPSQIVGVGQRVTVEVLGVDIKRRRVDLSVKSMLENPWTRFAREHQIGQIVRGTVTKVVSYGAFVQLGDGVAGLIHVSQMGRHRFDPSRQAVRVGDHVAVQILAIDLGNRRISLRLRQGLEGQRDVPTA